MPLSSPAGEQKAPISPRRLLHLLESETSDTEVRLSALAALSRLALDSERRDELRELKVLESILALLDTADLCVREKALAAVWSLATDDRTRVTLVEVGGLRRLLNFLPKESSGDEFTGTRLQCNALGALANVAAHPEGNATIIDVGGYLKIARVLDDGQPISADGSAELQALARQRAVHCLENLALDQLGRYSLRQLKLEPRLLEMVLCDQEPLVRAASALLRNLLVDEESQTQWCSIGGIPVLADLLSRTDPAIAANAAQAIGHLSLQEAYRPVLLEADVVAGLLKALQQGRTVDLRSSVVGALLNLAVDSEGKAAVLREGGAVPLVALLRESDEEGKVTPNSLRTVAAMALLNLATEAEGAEAVAAAGGVSAVLGCLAPRTNDMLEEKAAGVLWALCSVPKLKERLSQEAGMISALSGILENFKFAPALENCLGVATALAGSPSGRAAMLQGGLASPLVRLLDSEHSTVVERAAGALWNLCHEESAQTVVRHSGGLVRLLALLKRDSPLIRFNALGPLPLLTESPDGAREAAALGAVPPLVGILGAESNVLTLQNAAQALANIADGSAERQQALLDAHALSCLVRVVRAWVPRDESDGPHQPDWRSKQELLAKSCVAIWLACEKNQDAQLALAEAGGLLTLSVVLQPAFEASVLEAATGALCAALNDCPPNQERFREEGCLDPLVAMMRHPRQSVRSNAAKTLRHLCEDAETLRTLRETGVVDLMVDLMVELLQSPPQG